LHTLYNGEECSARVDVTLQVSMAYTLTPFRVSAHYSRGTVLSEQADSMHYQPQAKLSGAVNAERVRRNAHTS